MNGGQRQRWRPGARRRAARRHCVALGLLDGKTPFELSLTIKPLLPPSGYYGGLFQCLEYAHAGFRFCLNDQLKLGPRSGRGRARAPGWAGILMGDSAGRDYDYNGVIQCVAIRARVVPKP